MGHNKLNVFKIIIKLFVEEHTKENKAFQHIHKRKITFGMSKVF